MLRFSLRASGLLAVLCLFSLSAVHAADPANGTLSPANPSLSYSSGPFLVSNPVGVTANGEPDCVDPVLPCDDYTLTLDLPANYMATNPTARISVSVAWDTPGEDYDVFLYENDAVIAQSASSANPESYTSPAGQGSRTLTLRIVPYTAAGGTTTATIELINPPPASEVNQQQPSGLPPRFYYFQSPEGFADGAGEPTLGVNPNSKAAMFIASLEVDRVTFAENSSAVDAAGNALPASCDPTWEDASYAAAVNTLDPILETDPSSGRTFQSQLTGANSLFAYTDDDGLTWTPGQLASPPNGGADHQTVGSGPYSPDFVGVPNPDGYAVYYCSQSVTAAFCARSDTGGLTFGPGIPFLITPVDCNGGIGALHGHVQVAPNDGTVYVPFKSCDTTQAVAVSTDSGATWAVNQVPNSTPGGSDPAVGVGSDGTAYFCYTSDDGSPHVQVSSDRGTTWGSDYDIGAAAGIARAVFPTAVAGDGDRAACAFVGTQTDGNYEGVDFQGIWYPYVAVTYDRGQSWHTVNLSPNDPIQGAGGICLSGTTCGANRNLLDFIDITTDERGRVLVAYADGCVGACIKDPIKNSFTDDGVIVRQSGGRSLLASFDGPSPAPPGGACLAGTRTSQAVSLSWVAPDNGGADISSYQVLRGTSAASVTTQVGTVNGKTTFIDTSADPNVADYYYRIVAVNSAGQGVGNVIDLPITALPIPESSCTLPGLTVATDEVGDCTADACTAQTDLASISVAELPGSPDKLVFNIKVDSLAPTPAPGNYWLVLTTDGDGNNFYLSMDTMAATPAYSYGTYTAGTAGLLTFTAVGDLDAASTFSTDGNIYLVADKSLFGNPQPGDVISPIDVRTRTGTNAAPSRDTIAVGDYTVQGTADCGVPGLPQALLGASTQRGQPPLDVNFTVTGGVAAPGDTLQSYTLDFGDGSAVVMDQPFGGAASVQVAHTYSAAGLYPARLTVTDSNGMSSVNSAERVIDTTPATPAPTDGGGNGGGSQTGTDFGGALSLLALLPLLGIGLRRRWRMR